MIAINTLSMFNLSLTSLVFWSSCLATVFLYMRVALMNPGFVEPKPMQRMDTDHIDSIVYDQTKEKKSKTDRPGDKRRFLAKGPSRKRR